MLSRMLRIGVPQSYVAPSSYLNMMLFIAKQLNMTTELIPIPSNVSIFDYLQEGHVDCTGDLWTISNRRLAMNLSFTIPVDNTNTVFVVPELEVTIWSPTAQILKIFEPVIWMLIGVTTCLFVVLVVVQNNISVRFTD